MFSLKNIIAGGPGRTAKSPDVFEAAAPETSGVWHGFQPLGFLVGRQHGHAFEQTIRAANWVKTNDGTSSFVTADGNPPTLVLTTQATGNTGTQGQFSKDGGTAAWPCFKPVAGMPIFFETLIKLSSVSDPGLLVGFAPVDTSLLDGTSTIGGVANFLGFYKAPGAALLQGALRKANTNTLVGLRNVAGNSTNMVDDTYVSLGLRVNGVTSVDFFVNGVRTSTAVITNLPAVDLALSVALDTGSANARTATIRRIMAFQEAA